MTGMPIRLPDGLEKQRSLGPDWGRWLDSLPRTVAELLDEWDLTREGEELWYGFCSLVAPVLTGDGTRAALKISFDGDDESVHEPLALQHWRGNGAVRLLRADPHRRTMLLERLDRRDLTELWDVEACEIVAGLYSRIHRPALPQLATVTSYVERWLADLAALPPGAPIPLRYREQAMSLGRELVSDPASVGRIVHGDLHYENVLAAPPELAAERGEWLVIDPKPMSGDPHYEPAPMLWNRRGRHRPARPSGSTPWWTGQDSTKTAPATGSSSGWCSTPAGQSTTRSVPTGSSTTRTGSGSPAASPSARRSRTERPGLTRVGAPVSEGAAG